MRFLRELDKEQDSQRALVLITNGLLELLAETLVKNKCKNSNAILGDNRSYGYSTKLLLLNEIGIVSDSIYKTLKGFNRIRNKAAHEPFFEVTSGDLEALRSDLNTVLNNDMKSSADLYHCCTTLFGILWNSHLDIFKPVFAPSLEA